MGDGVIFYRIPSYKAFGYFIPFNTNNTFQNDGPGPKNTGLDILKSRKNLNFYLFKLLLWVHQIKEILKPFFYLKDLQVYSYTHTMGIHIHYMLYLREIIVAPQ